MKLLAIELGLLIHKYEEKLTAIGEDDYMRKPSPEKWSKKEELGHIIDSAHNNLRRFIVAQHEEKPTITYKQNEWVAASDYNTLPTSDLILLWRLLNLQMCQVMKTMHAEAANRLCNTGNKLEELHTLEWLANDYIKHLEHHLHHLLELEPVAY